MVSLNATTDAEPSAIGTSELLHRGLLALITVCLVNIVILVSSLVMIDVPSTYVGGMFGPLAVGPVVINSTVAAVGAMIVYRITTRFAARPNQTFTIIAGGALLLSSAMFLSPHVADAPASLFVVLGLMHIAAAIVTVGILTRGATDRGRSR